MPEYEFGVIKWSGLVHYFRDIEGNQYLENSHVTPLLKTLGELGWELSAVVDNPDMMTRDYYMQRQKHEPKPFAMAHYIQHRADEAQFDELVDEVTDLLYTGFEAGGAPGNLQQLGPLLHLPEYAVEKDWLVIVDKAALRRSIEQIFDAKL